MGRRVEHVDRTKLRITEAAMRLHTTVGPAAASMSAVAEEAGVTRVTLYRHFSTMDALFGACMGHWRSLHPPPDAEAWTKVADFEPRVRRALAELYGWYAENAADLYPVYRDAAHTPPSNRAARRASNARMVEAMLAGLSLKPSVAQRMRATLAHVVGFWTWRSLAVDGSLSQREAIDLAASFVLAARG